MKLTVNSVPALKLPPGKSERIVFDDVLAGWGLRLRLGGAYWIFQYSITGNDPSGASRRMQRRITFGKYPAIGVPAARAEAERLYAETKLGRDPAGDKAEQQARAGETFGACLKLYLERRHNDGKLRASSYSEIERHLHKNLAALHGLPIHKVDRRAIALELSRLTAIGPVQANRTRTSLVKFLNWCAGEGYVDGNPATFTNVNPEIARDRVLSLDELAQIWRALPAGDYGSIVKLLTLTGARAREVGGLRWGEIDLERGLIVIPGTRTKNRRQHVIPLSATARSILAAQPRRDGRDIVFGKGQSQRGFNGWGLCKARLDHAVNIEAFVVHDIRRSVATGMADIGILPHVIEAVLNHQSGAKAGVAGIYNRSTYEAEKADAFARWDEHLAAALTAKKPRITPLKRA
jgi:integrase